MDRRNVLKWLGMGAVGGVLPAWAQDDYPARPITIMVGSTPGSATDLAARLAAEVLRDAFGQTVVVENKAGAGGVICMQAVAARAPDGYTLQLGGLGHNVIPAVTRADMPLDVSTSLMPIAQAAEFLNVLLVGRDHPANTLQEFIDYQKKADKVLLYGSNGVGSSSHLTSELFGQRTGLKVQHVPYKAASDALVGVSQGDLDLLFMNLPPSLPMIQSGRLKPLAVTSAYRARQLPQVPTMQEQGMEDFEVTSWLGLYGPAGIPEPIVRKLSAALLKGFDTPDYESKFISAGFERRLRDTADFTAWNRSERERWGEVAEKGGLQKLN